MAILGGGTLDTGGGTPLLPAEFNHCTGGGGGGAESATGHKQV